MSAEHHAWFQGVVLPAECQDDELMPTEEGEEEEAVVEEEVGDGEADMGENDEGEVLAAAVVGQAGVSEECRCSGGGDGGGGGGGGGGGAVGGVVVEAPGSEEEAQARVDAEQFVADRETHADTCMHTHSHTDTQTQTQTHAQQDALESHCATTTDAHSHVKLCTHTPLIGASGGSSTRGSAVGGRRLTRYPKDKGVKNAKRQQR